MLRAAMKLADEGGIKAVSMRKIAQELGVEAMSLYNHVASKDEIVDGIVDLVATEIDLAPTGDDWKEAMRRRVISAHEVLLQHPWACNLWMSGETFGAARMRYADAVLRGFREGGFPEELTYHAFHVIQSHIMGFTMYVASFDFDVEELEQLAADFLETFPADVLGKVRVVVSRKRLEEVRRQPLQLLNVEVEARHVHREAHDVALDDVEGVVRQLLRKAALPEAAEHRVRVPHARCAERLARHPEVAGPGMLEQHLVGGDHAPAHRLLPVLSGRGEVDLGGDEVDDAVHDLVLRGDVVVERHRLDAQLLGDLPHADRLDPALVGELHRRTQHSIPVQPWLDRLTVYV